MRSAARQNAYATLTQGRTGVPPVFIGGGRIPGALEQPKNLHRTPQSSQTAQGQSTKTHRVNEPEITANPRIPSDGRTPVTATG